MTYEKLKELVHEEFQQMKGDILSEIRKSESESRYLTRKDVARYMNCGLSTVDYWARTGKLQKINIDGTVRFDKVVIDELLKVEK